MQSVRQATLFQLGQNLRELLHLHLLSSEEDGLNSRNRAFSLRLTCECFTWQMLTPGTSCREGVRHVQALCRLLGHAPIDEGTSAYVQARQRVPQELLERGMQATATAADCRSGDGGRLQGRPVKVVDGSTTQLADTEANQGMKSLRCQSPAMARKEMPAFHIAHNLTRCVMAEAARLCDADLERIGFKGTLDALRQYSTALSAARNRKVRHQLSQDLLVNLVRDQVPLRPKPCPLLNRPRRQFKEIPHRSRYRKNTTRNS